MTRGQFRGASVVLVAVLAAAGCANRRSEVAATSAPPEVAAIGESPQVAAVSEPLYKLLDERGKEVSAGGVSWPLPRRGQPGAWKREVTDLSSGDSGYQLLREQDLMGPDMGPCLYTAEARGERMAKQDHIVVGQARLLALVPEWNEQAARRLALDCALRVVHLTDHEKLRPLLERAWETLADEDLLKLREAAAAEMTARVAAEMPATATLAASTAGIGSPSWAASRASTAAAMAVTGADERTWQNARLMAYLHGEVTGPASPSPPVAGKG